MIDIHRIVKHWIKASIFYAHACVYVNLAFQYLYSGNQHMLWSATENVQSYHNLRSSHANKVKVDNDRYRTNGML